MYKRQASYNIGGTTVVSVSDLAGYGFQVEWDPETRWVTVTSAQRPERMPEPDITREGPGTVRGSYYATDIRVLFNGNELEHVYNIGGWMMIPLSEAVSYTHLDVYKRQVAPRLRMEVYALPSFLVIWTVMVVPLAANLAALSSRL